MVRLLIPVQVMSARFSEGGSANLYRQRIHAAVLASVVGRSPRRSPTAPRQPDPPRRDWPGDAPSIHTTPLPRGSTPVRTPAGAPPAIGDVRQSRRAGTAALRCWLIRSQMTITGPRRCLSRSRAEDDHLAFGDVARHVHVQVQVQPPTPRRDRPRRAGADRGDLPMMPLRMMKNGCLADRRPAPLHDRQQHQPRFVDEDDVGPETRRLFFMRGQSTATHLLMACSSRALARRAGFRQEKPKPRKSRGR